MVPPTPSAHRDTFARDGLPPAEQWPELVTDLPELRYPRLLNCAHELLDTTIERYGADRPALYDQDGREWSYARLRDRANRIAHLLVDDHGLVPGNRVLLRGPNSPWLVACWLAALKAGAVVVTTMPLLRAGELKQITDRAQVQLALCEQDLTGELEAHAASPAHASSPTPAPTGRTAGPPRWRPTAPRTSPPCGPPQTTWR